MGCARESSVAGAPAATARPWWEHAGLRAAEGRLRIAGRDAEKLAREHGTPLFVYDVTHVEENLRLLQGALARTGCPWKVRLALKAQRAPEILARARVIGEPGTPAFVGLDVCSPGEMLHGLEHGFPAGEISYTRTNVSERDLDVILESGAHVNLDLLSQIRRYGRRAPGGAIGLRLNPRVSAARPDSGISYYSGDTPTKFGIYPEQLDEALALARRYDLTVDTVHFHVSHHLLDDDLPAFDQAVAAATAMARRVIDAGCPVREVNVGGGLAAPMVQGQRPLDLDAYAAVLARHLGPLGVVIACEPGEMISKHAGTMLAEVITVEDRLGATFVGLDYGWNVMHLVFVYHEYVESVLCRAADAARTETYTLTSHINEGPDLLAESYPLPPVEEGDIIAVLGVGAYCQPSWHTHCLRPFPEVLYFDDRSPV